MEEKERYEIHIYDDICVDLYDNGVLDKSINDTYKLEELLNQQDKRIKELEEELDDAKRDYIPKLEFGLQRANKMGRDAEKENQQLKDQARKAYQEGLLQKQFDKDMEIQELKDKIEQLKQQLALTEKALDYAIFELDFARNHSQSTNSETIERIDKLRNKILNKAKEMLENE